MTFAIAGAAVVSLIVLFLLFQKHIDGQPLLAYEPRRVPPWNFAAPLLLLAPVFLAGRLPSTASDPDPHAQAVLWSGLVQTTSSGVPPAAAYAAAATLSACDGLIDAWAKAGAMPLLLLQSAAVSITLTAACYALLRLVFGATRHDLGLPADARQFLKDVGIGATAFAASLAPVYLLLFVLNMIFKTDEGHPLIQELVVDHSPAMMIAAALTAVVAAPLDEETAFRLALQGWLERRAALARAPAAPPPAESHAPPEPAPDGPIAAADRIAPPLEPQPAPPPSGWAPVILSGALFGLAHLGHGLSPAPLILLGIILGYLYQRTHRITPCIACHTLFNAYTFLMLTLQFSSR
ncbi:MAG: CPBP family intramembrane metalloprotease [Pirellulales bacterium]|nr:CPBP family intramembrane metalloprotease [Pirellulales bacterium]